MKTRPKLAQAFAEMTRIRAGIRRVCGPREIACARNEAVVACMVRNGEGYIEQFMEHYFSLGAKHIVFLDNGSADRTIALARRRRGVSVFEYPLPIGRGEMFLRRYLIGVCRPHWTLCADIDEFFDYPFSGRVGLDGLIEYLNAHSHTALITQMLDMFSREIPPVGRDFVRADYPFYDVAGIETIDYRDARFGSRLKDNVVSNDAVKFHLGGVRRSVFGSGNWLTKHSLIRPAEIVLTDPHCVSRARCADLSGVVFHYKFTPSFHERARDYVATGFGGMPPEYAAILKAGRSPRVFDPATARKFRSIEELVDDGFLVVSDRYRRWVRRLTGRRRRGLP
ncbi:MAG: glycosyltransferase family 2 protein [Elusimicrobiota bacterium]